MNVYIASDHAGYALKSVLVDALRDSGYEIEDLGAHEFDPADDYPDFILPLAERVAEENARLEKSAVGIILGGSGQGEAMCANRVIGIRAAVFYGGVLAHDDDIVALTRHHNDANILSLGARFLSNEDAIQAAETFLSTPFSEEERHVRRINAYN
jgi:ribose 5-phosphate isomerase B